MSVFLSAFIHIKIIALHIFFILSCYMDQTFYLIDCFINLKFLEVWVFIYTFALDTANIRHESAWKYFISEFSCFKGNVFYFTCKKIIFKNLGNSMRRKIIYHLCNMINFSIFDNYLHQKCVLSPSFSFSYYSTHPSPHYPHLSLGLRQ